jgi:hypothetical protein
LIFIEGNYRNKTDLKNNAACKFVETKTLENNVNSSTLSCNTINTNNKMACNLEGVAVSADI